jgi:hypothetical protein
MATYQSNPHLAKPPRVDTLTKSAERARRSVADMPPQRVVVEAGERKLTRKPLTRAEVVAAYVPPAPEESARVIGIGGIFETSTFNFAKKCGEFGADVKVTVARGTTRPRWRVPAPSKTNPDVVVDAADYRGDVVDSVVVWARKFFYSPGNFAIGVRKVEVRAEWHDGRVHEVTVNGQKSSLKAALEALS